MYARQLLLLVSAALALHAGSASAKETLRVLAFSGYADHDWVVQFEKMTKSSVEITTIDSDDELRNKMDKNQGQDFDVFASNPAELQYFIDKGIASPIVLEKIPNTKNQLPRFQELARSPGIMRDNKTYAVPYTYSEMGLIYDRKQFKQAPTTMADMWDPKFKGKILLYDGSSHNFSLTALVLGIANPFVLSEADRVRVIKKLVELRANEPLFYESPEQGTKEFMENKVALMFGNFGTQQVKKLRDAGADIGYIIPSEGALAWLDCWAISSQAKNRALAEAWINFTLSKPISTALSKRQQLANTLTKSSLSAQDKILWLEPVENSEQRSEVWNRIRKDKARAKSN